MNMYWSRICGIFGIMGGIILFAGDMLFYYHAENTNVLENMSMVSEDRIRFSALSALLASWFYCIGLGNIYYALQPSPKKTKNFILASLAAIFIAYGVIHGAYVAIATSAKIAAQHKLDLYETTKLASESNNLLRLLVYPIFGILSVIFIREVWIKRTLYSRSMILFFPLLPFLLQGFIGRLLPRNLWVIIMGGYLNLLLILFFSASTVYLWNKKGNEY